MNDPIAKFVIGILTAGVIAGCGILWQMSETLTRIETTVKFLEKDYDDHERRIIALESNKK